MREDPDAAYSAPMQQAPRAGRTIRERWLTTLGSRPVMFVFVAAAVLGGVIGLDTLVLHLTVDPFADVRAYYEAGARLNAGMPLYVQSATTDDPGFYRYPPLLAVAFRPLALLSFQQAAVIWEALLATALGATILRLGIRRRWTWLLVGWLAAPIGWSLAVGQAQVLVTFLLTVGTPLGVAAAAQLKLFPIAAAIYWSARRDGRALLAVGMWTGLLSLLSLILEPRGTLDFLSFSDLGQVGTVVNMSPYGVSPWLYGLSLVGLLAVAWRLARTRFGWAAAVALVVFATPRLLMYQLSTLLAAGRAPDG